jgi:hypothetical protein
MSQAGEVNGSGSRALPPAATRTRPVAGPAETQPLRANLDRGVTTPTTHRWYLGAAGGRALNENQRPGDCPGEGVRNNHG